MKTSETNLEQSPCMERPYVISWNLTYRCNLVCEHCYLDAGSSSRLTREDRGDRSELDTAACFAVIDEIADFAPECMTILTGGEPLLRRDILEIISYAHKRDLWVVVGTNGVFVTEELGRKLAEAGTRGMSLSLDALSADDHDRFRGIEGSWENTVQGAEVLKKIGLPFIIQTTIAAHNAPDLQKIARFVYEKLEAKVWNLYFLVPTGRGSTCSVSADMSAAQYDRVLADILSIQKEYTSRMMVNAKCAPHFIKTLLEDDANSPFIRTYTGGSGGCPAGTHYMGIRPNGDVTPCPYLPVFAGNLKTERLPALWNSSELFTSIRRRNDLGGRCGTCEFGGHCGGCRARAYGMTGDYMEEDPLCSYVPGTLPLASQLLSRPASMEYGVSADKTIEWETEATERIKQVPAFVRGMVTKSVESYCRKNGIAKVTPKALDAIRAKMPASRIFGGKR